MRFFKVQNQYNYQQNDCLKDVKMDKFNTSFWKLRHGNKKRRKIINLSSKPSLRKKIFIHSKNINYETQKKKLIILIQQLRLANNGTFCF